MEVRRVTIRMLRCATSASSREISREHHGISREIGHFGNTFARHFGYRGLYQKTAPDTLRECLAP